MKKIKNKIIEICSLIITGMVIFQEVLAAGSFSATLSSSSVIVGTNVTLTVNANDCAGRFNIYSSDTSIATVSSNSEFLDKNNTVITVTTKKAGNVTITVEAKDVADYSGDTVSGAKELKLTVKAKETTTTTPGTTTKSSDATLSSLRLNVEGMTPTFNKNTTIYSVNVDNSVQSISVYATVSNSKAWYNVSGNTNLKTGTNVITVKVTAEDYTTKTYKITVTKADDVTKSNARLLNVIINNATLNEEFNPDVLDYTLKDVLDIEKLNMDVFPENEKATIEISGTENLQEGSNQIVVSVTAEDKVTVRNYTFTFNYSKTEVENITEEINDTLEESAYAKVTNYVGNVWEICKANSTLILVYMFALVELFQIIYLYNQLYDTSKNTSKEESETRRK